MPPEASWNAAVRRAWWLALALGCLFLLSIVLNPVAGVVFAAIFFSIAWGIRRRRFWAAVAGLAVLLLGLSRVVSAWGSIPPIRIVITVFPLVAMMGLMAGAVAALWRHPRASRRLSGWIAFLAVLGVYAACAHPYVLSSGRWKTRCSRGIAFWGRTSLGASAICPNAATWCRCAFPKTRGTFSSSAWWECPATGCAS